MNNKMTTKQQLEKEIFTLKNKHRVEISRKEIEINRHQRTIERLNEEILRLNEKLNDNPNEVIEDLKRKILELTETQKHNEHKNKHEVKDKDSKIYLLNEELKSWKLTFERTIKNLTDDKIIEKQEQQEEYYEDRYN